MHEHYTKTKAKDPVKFLVRKKEIQHTFRENNPDKEKANTKRSCDNAVKNKRHYCAVCDFAFRKSTSLANHLKRKVHLDKVALLRKSASQSSGL